MDIARISSTKGHNHESACNSITSLSYCDSSLDIQHLQELERKTRKIMNENQCKDNHKSNAIIFVGIVSKETGAASVGT